MDTKFQYKCITCNQTYSKEDVLYLCPVCSKQNTQELPPKGILKVIYNKLPQHIEACSLSSSIIRFEELKMNQFIDLFPIKNINSLPKLKIGETPLYKYTVLENKKIPFALYIKDDSQNPTYSYKDRASAIVSAYAKENGFETIVAASTGNAGSSIAGICASQGQKAIVLVPESAPIAKLTQIIMYGAILVPVKGTYDDAFELSIKASKEFDWYNRNTAFNPLTIEGKKTVSFELFEQLNYNLPDRIFVPVGDGVIISGIYKGFEDLHKIGVISKIPTIVAIQSTGSCNLVNNITSSNFKVARSVTIADSISVDVPRNFYMTKSFIQKYKGEFVSISDDKILEASAILSKNTGLFTEPASAAAFAGFLSHYSNGKIEKDSKNIVLLTGSGLKNIDSVQHIIKPPNSIKPDINQMKSFMKKIGLLLIVYLLSFNQLFSQENKTKFEEQIDSLKQELAEASKEKKGKIYLKIAYKFSKRNADSSIAYAKMGQRIGIETKNDTIIADALTERATVYIRKGHYKEAKEKLDSALEIYSSLKDLKGISITYNTYVHYWIRMSNLDNATHSMNKAISYLEQLNDTLAIAIAKMNLGIIYTRKGDFVKALEYLYLSVEALEKTDNVEQLGNAYINIAILLAKNKEHDKALNYYKKAIDINIKLGTVSRVAEIYFNVANIYNQQGKWDKAIDNVNRFIEIKKQSGETKTLGRAFGALGSVYKEMGDYEKASFYFEKAYNSYKEGEDKIRLAEQLNNMALINSLMGNYAKAIAYAKKAIIVTNEHTILLKAYKILDECYAKQGRYKKAYQAKFDYHQLNDSITGLKKQEQLNELEIKYKTAAKEKEIIELRDINYKSEIELLKANQTKYIFIGIICMILIVGLFLFYIFKKRQKQKQDLLSAQKTDIENRLLRSQINPHFIYNCLNSVNGYIMNRDEKKAISYLANFGKLIRTSLDFSMQETITLNQEVSMLKVFLDLEQQRLGSKMNYDIIVEENIEDEIVQIPPMIIQPFIENSIKHGISYKKDGGYVNISFSKQNNDSSLVCTIKDNGVGRGIKLEQNKKHHTSYGQKLTKDRLSVFEKKYKQDFCCEIIDLEEKNAPAGTLVKITMPYILS